MTLKDVIPRVKWMRRKHCHGLSIAGLSVEAPSSRTDPSTLDFAMRRGDVVIEELRRGAEVARVQARNHGTRPVLLLAGEEIVGARQNRILNASVWIEPSREVRVPVSCVEQGRWSAPMGAGFRSNSTMYFPSGLRAHTLHVARGYAAKGTATGSQGQVWSDVQTRLQAAGARTATLSMNTLYAAADGTLLDEFAQSLKCGARQSGFAAFVDDALVGIEIFPSAAFCSAVYGKYLRAYALDQTLAGARSSFGFTDLESLLERVRELPVQSFRSAGRGQDVRFECALFHGSALVLPGGRLAHLSLYVS